jgi:hypothetical protein
MDSLPPRYGEAYERVKNAGGRKNRLSSGNLREQVVHLLPIPDSALLRTPVASEAAGGAVAPEVAKANGQTLRLSGQMIDMVAPNQLPKLPTPTVSDQYTGNLASTQQKPGSMHSVTLAQVFHKPELFPTPNTMEHREIKTPEQIAILKANSPGGYRNLRETVINELPILPTPIVRDYKDGSSDVMRDGKVQTDTVARTIFSSGEISQTKWGKFEPAIRRWESILGRPAPEPTKPDGKDNNHRLSSKFTEWMMGLPDGWITGHDLKRNDELKLAGNGVVPQQAELALRLLLDLPERDK